MNRTYLAATALAVITVAGCEASRPPPPAEQAANDPATQQWAALAKLPDWSGVWEVDWRNARGSAPRPPMKLTPEWQAKADQYRAAQAQGENLQSEAANCVPPGLPGIMSQPYPIQFLYQPDKVVMLIETFMQFRQIWTDGRPHPDDPDLTFYGDSTGHWEGDTLVVETVGLNPQNQIAPGVGHGEQLRIVERIKRVDADWLEIETTLTDPEVLAVPYTSTASFKHLDDAIREYICLENNRDSADEQGRPGIELE
jgi:hypothetical protein